MSREAAQNEEEPQMAVEPHELTYLLKRKRGAVSVHVRPYMGYAALIPEGTTIEIVSSAKSEGDKRVALAEVVKIEEGSSHPEVARLGTERHIRIEVKNVRRKQGV